jgi:MFS family permease
MNARFPPGIGNLFAFQVFNTFSWSVIQGIPLLLFLKSQGVPATVIGIATALNPLFMVLQLPAAGVAARTGYRRFVLRGWTARTGFVAGIALVAVLAPWLGATATIVLVLAQLMAYTAFRGIATAGFLPWFSQIIPEPVRGRFLGIESAVLNLTIIVSLAGCSLFLARWSTPGGYAALFLWSFATGAVALLFLRRIPESPAEPEGVNHTAVPWRAILGHRPFLRVVAYNTLVNIALAGAGVLWVTLLKDRFAATDARITLLPVISAGVNVLLTPIIGPLLDRTGSRPVLLVSAVLFAAHLLLWWSLAAGLMPYGWATLVAIQASAGLAMSLFGIANMRLLMGVVPGQGRAHFFAMHSVAVALSLGLTPIAWGAAIDLMHGLDHGIWNAWSILYLVITGCALAALVPMWRIAEPQARTASEFLHELLVRTPQRALARLVNWVTPS